MAWKQTEWKNGRETTENGNQFMLVHFTALSYFLAAQFDSNFKTDIWISFMLYKEAMKINDIMQLDEEIYIWYINQSIYTLQRRSNSLVCL